MATSSLRRGDITARVATRLGGSRAQGEAALNAVLGVVQDALSSGDRVVLTGFGAFWVTGVKERRVRSIRGGQLTTVPGHKLVRFRAGQDLSNAVKG